MSYWFGKRRETILSIIKTMSLGQEALILSCRTLGAPTLLPFHRNARGVGLLGMESWLWSSRGLFWNCMAVFTKLIFWVAHLFMHAANLQQTSGIKCVRRPLQRWVSILRSFLGCTNLGVTAPRKAVCSLRVPAGLTAKYRSHPPLLSGWLLWKAVKWKLWGTVKVYTSKGLEEGIQPSWNPAAQDVKIFIIFSPKSWSKCLFLQGLKEKTSRGKLFPFVFATD